MQGESGDDADDWPMPTTEGAAVAVAESSKRAADAHASPTASTTKRRKQAKALAKSGGGESDDGEDLEDAEDSSNRSGSESEEQTEEAQRERRPSEHRRATIVASKAAPTKEAALLAAELKEALAELAQLKAEEKLKAAEHAQVRAALEEANRLEQAPRSRLCFPHWSTDIGLVIPWVG